MSSNHRILLDFQITQADFANLIGVSEGAVSAMFTEGKLERGNPARDLLYPLKILGFFELKNQNVPPDNPGFMPGFFCAKNAQIF